MAAVKPQPPAPEQPPAAPAPGALNLDTLQSMLNLIFLQSGRFIKEHQAGGGTGRMKMAMQRAVPVATERFHDALDDLEDQVRLAQVVLRRDLALLEQDRKQREVAARAKEAEKARLAAQSKTAGTVEKQPAPVVEKELTPAQEEAPAESEPEQQPKQPESEKPLEREEEKVAPPIDPTAPPATQRDPLLDGAPTTANPQENEFDFDAIFGDSMDTSNDNNPDDLMDTSGNMDFNFDEAPSLLRGLEDFAKSGDNDNNTAQDDADADVDIDITMPDLPGLNTETTTGPNPAPEQPAKPPTPPPPTAPPPAPTQAPTQPAANNENLAGGITTDNLDDLFNMDEYENPEQSSFDDAFFNFE
ncbi:hypothetical protein BDU57DRAFT_515023 [Ampelomyces quisqualis]|uniref:Uncharacterized protein n=1 Tax=Ampelomyces quisqualis TaxID=50730 RepID=A0A6A5QRL6_AMPQU|nr:hypothetical protein BDU57DRAFT_515023 [Ampelomyces quisqualis]